MADTRFIDVPLSGITSKDYAEELAKKVDMAKSQDFSYGDPWNYEEESQNTTNFVVMDKTGNMVTHTINSFWGSHDYVDGYGFYLNNQLGDFVVGDGYANSVEPGKSPLSSMSPTIVFDQFSSAAFPAITACMSDKIIPLPTMSEFSEFSQSNSLDKDKATIYTIFHELNKIFRAG